MLQCKLLPWKWGKWWANAAKKIGKKNREATFSVFFHD